MSPGNSHAPHLLRAFIAESAIRDWTSANLESIKAGYAVFEPEHVMLEQSL